MSEDEVVERAIIVSDLAEASVRARKNIFLDGDPEEIASQLANIIQSVL